MANASSDSLLTPLDEADARHLLARTGIGVAAADVLALQGLSRAEAIEHIVEGLRTSPSQPMPAWTHGPAPPRHARGSWTRERVQQFERERDAEIGELRQWWTHEMLLTDSPQTERLVLLWHDLVPSAYPVTDRASLALARQNALFRRLHSDDWATLLKALLRDAALLDYLDADRNRRNAPNENLAREFLELFTLGEGTFSERDVREAARALTGLSTSDIRGLSFRLRSWDQDRGDKTLFGQSGAFDADGLVDITLSQPAAADHLTRVYWHAFVSDASPTDEELAPIVTAFRDSGLNLRALYRATLRSEAFWAPRHRASLIKSPIDLLSGLARTLEYPKRHAARLPALQAALGMNLFAPPNVAGWQEGAAFVAPGRLIARYAAVERMLDADSAPDGASDPPATMMMAEEQGVQEMNAEASELTVRVASEAYRGPARIAVALLQDGLPSWRSDELTLTDGQDTERFGRADDRQSLAWQTLDLSPPAERVQAADAVRVTFLNDAAGAGGDRNVYLDRVRLAGDVLEATRGTQQSDCPPERSIDAGNLYCAGHVTIARPTAVRALADAPVSASAVHLRWANSNLNGRQSLVLAIDDLKAPGVDVPVMQLRLVAEPGQEPQLRFDSFDCRDGCLQRWPACAWQDPHFAPVRALSIPLSAVENNADACIASLDTPDALLVELLPRLLPALLDHIVATASPAYQQHKIDVDALHERVRAQMLDRSDDQAILPATIDVDERRRPSPPRPVRLDPHIEPVVASLDALEAALDDHRLDAITLLWPGTEIPDAVRDRSRPLAQRLDTVIHHPAFQLR